MLGKWEYQTLKQVEIKAVAEGIRSWYNRNRFLRWTDALQLSHLSLWHLLRSQIPLRSIHLAQFMQPAYPFTIQDSKRKGTVKEAFGRSPWLL